MASAHANAHPALAVDQAAPQVVGDQSIDGLVDQRLPGPTLLLGDGVAAGEAVGGAQVGWLTADVLDAVRVEAGLLVSHDPIGVEPAHGVDALDRPRGD